MAERSAGVSSVGRWLKALRRQLAFLCLLAPLFPSAFGLEPGVPTPATFRTDRIIVRTTGNASALAVDELHRRVGARVRHSFRHFGNTLVVEVPRGRRVEDAIAAYRADRQLVASAEPDYLLQAFATPTDLHYRNGDQWNLDNTAIYGGVPGADIHAAEGWDVRTDASNIIVAVIDSGVRYTHEDLAPNMWVNPGESGLDSLNRDRRSNGIDDDANGYVDDVHGINVLNGSGNPLDDWGHGTHVAGIVGAVGNNDVGIAGVAWRVKIMALKFIDASANYSVSDAILCLDYARQHGAKIVTASWGGYSFESPALRNAIGQLRTAGIIVTAAAGNDNSNNDAMPLFPASYDFDNIVTVAATDRSDARAGYSNYGLNTVDLGAPGSPVFSSWAGSDRDYRYNEGTSMAAPHLAGAFALLWARFPGESHQQIIQRVMSTVDSLPSLSGRTKSGGRLNLAAALASGSPPPPPAALPAPSNLIITASSASSLTLSWSDNATTESGFEIERSTNNASFVSSGTAAANATSAIISGLTPGTAYYVRVRAVASGTASAYSNTPSAATSTTPPPPSGSWSSADVGAVAAAGSGSGSGIAFNVTGSGADIWDRNDEFLYHHRTWNGDGTFVVQVTGMTNTDSWAKAGIMLRESLAPGSRHILLGANPASAAALFWRSTSGGVTDFRYGGYSISRIWLKLVRTGNSFQAFQSGNGVNWLAMGGPVTVDMPAAILAGLAVTSHRDGVLCTASFDQLAFDGGSAPPPAPTVTSPSALAATATSATQISLSWVDNSSNETGFQLERSTDNVNFVLVATPAANATAHADAGLNPSSPYYYRIRATAGSATSGYSNTASVSTPAAPVTVAAPGSLTAVASSASQINLAWSDNSNNETGFEIQRSGDGANFTNLANVAANATSYSNTALTASTTYFYRVRASAGSAASAFSNTASGTTPAAVVTVAAPANLAAAVASSSQINLTWTDNSNNESSFEIQRSGDGANFTNLAIVAANANSYSNSALTASTTYFYRVRAIAGSAASTFSNTASATTTAASGPSDVWSHADVGAVGIPGSDDASGITITVRGSGSDIWDRADAFRFVYRTIAGDCTVEARVTSITNTHGWAKAGVMIRESLSPGSRNAFVFLSPSSGARGQLREITGGTTSTTSGPWGPVAPYWVRLVRTGNVIVASGSYNGTAWSTIATYTVAMNAEVHVGFAVTSHDQSKLNTATFEDPFIE